MGPEFPTLDWDEEKEECLCRSHPCWNDDGKRHECNTASGFPILRYREEMGKDDQVKPICECFQRMAAEADPIADEDEEEELEERLPRSAYENDFEDDDEEEEFASDEEF